MSTLVLIDLSAIFWAKWMATAGKDISAAFDYTTETVRKLAGQYDHTVICCDTGRTFRHDIDPQYKANRPPKDEAAMGQHRRVVDRLTADGFPVLAATGFEADDVIATAVAWIAAEHPETHTTIAGADKDLLQLVTDNVHMRTLRDNMVYGPAEVKIKFGVEPSQVRDMLALAGDTSDNVKGIDRVGMKIAADLLAKYGTLDGIAVALAASPDDFQPSILKNLTEQWDRLTISKQLVSLRTDVPVDCAAMLDQRQPKPIAQSGWTAEDNAMEFSVTQVADAAPASQAPANDAPPSAKAEPVRSESVQPSAAMAVVVDAGEAARRITVADKRSAQWALALEPSSTRDAYVLAKHLFNSRMFSNYPNEDAVFAGIMMGRSRGIDAITFLAASHVIEDKIVMHAAAIQALIMGNAKCAFFKMVESTAQKATYKTRRTDDPDQEVQTFTYYIEDAQTAGYVKPKSNWERIPRTMLRWRCVTEFGRIVYPDICSNIYSPEEIEDHREAPPTAAGAPTITIGKAA